MDTTVFVYRNATAEQRKAESGAHFNARPHMAIPVRKLGVQGIGNTITLSKAGTTVQFRFPREPICKEWLNLLSAASAGNPVAPPVTAPAVVSATRPAPVAAAVAAVAAAEVGYSESAATSAMQNKRNFPKVGDHVIAYHSVTSAFYMATIVAFDRNTYKYTVNWDDNDPSGRVMS